MYLEGGKTRFRKHTSETIKLFQRKVMRRLVEYVNTFFLFPRWNNDENWKDESKTGAMIIFFSLFSHLSMVLEDLYSSSVRSDAS